MLWVCFDYLGDEKLWELVKLAACVRVYVSPRYEENSCEGTEWKYKTGKEKKNKHSDVQMELQTLADKLLQKPLDE